MFLEIRQEKMAGIPLVIGVYFGFVKKKDNSTKEYLYGIGKMTAIPVGLSLYSSSTSAIMILGYTAESYVFGGQFLIAPVGFLLSLTITWYSILPVFCGPLNIASPYEYIELRFNYTVRMISSIFLVFGKIVFQAAHGGCGASSLQRYMALPNEKQARIIGLCMYAYFYACDPVANKQVSGYKELVPYYIAQILTNIPGFFGFFTAGLLSGGLRCDF
ncbi:kin of rumpel [Carabus blaptoides fortunei]